MENGKEDYNAILDYLEIIASRRAMIIRITTVAFVASIVMSLLLPKIYCSTTRVLPSERDSNGLSLMLGLMGGKSGFVGELMGKGTSSDFCVGIINTEVIKDSIIDRFKLMQLYNLKFRQDAYMVLDKKVKVEVGKKDGIVSISVEDKDPQRAADIANAYAEELNSLLLNLDTTTAGQHRGFLEKRLARAKTDLANAEDALKQFQSKNKALDVPDQAKGTFEGIAQLKAQQVALEVQLASLKSYMTDSSPEVINAKAAISKISSQVAQLEGAGHGSSIIPIGSAPRLGLEYVRLMREVKIQEALMELLTKQYELAAMSEEKNSAVVHILQKATPADKKIRPKRSLLVLVATATSFFLSVLAVLLLEYLKKVPYEEMTRFKQIVKSIIPVKKKKTTSASVS